MKWLVAWALVVLAALSGCTSDDAPAAKAAPSAAATSAAGCSTDYPARKLPSWAATGFRKGATIPYVVGDEGQIAAIVWQEHEPLVVPSPEGRNNKILWAARPPAQLGEDLHIRATLDGTGETVDRTIEGGPGPSTVDLPKPGCWSMELSWGEHRDHLRLAYAAA
jgi:hypothetical protein